MTRFNITLNEGIEFVDWCLKNNSGGEIFIPKLKVSKLQTWQKLFILKQNLKLLVLDKGKTS